MDPLSIAATTAALTKVSYEIARTLFGFTDATLHIDENINAFASEVASISRILQAVTSTLNDSRFRFSDVSTSHNANKDVWAALFGSVNYLGLYLDKLRFKLNEIGEKKESNNLFRQAIRALELSLAKNNVDSLRANLVTHQLSLNTALQMLQLYTHVQLPANEQPDLRPEIHRLISMVEKLPTADNVDRSNALKDSESDPTVNPANIARLKRVAMKVASDASVVAESTTTGSEYGAPLGQSRIGQIEDWLELSEIQESNEQNPSLGVSSGGAPTSNDSSNMSSWKGSSAATNTNYTAYTSPSVNSRIDSQPTTLPNVSKPVFPTKVEPEMPATSTVHVFKPASPSKIELQTKPVSVPPGPSPTLPSRPEFKPSDSSNVDPHVFIQRPILPGVRWSIYGLLRILRYIQFILSIALIGILAPYFMRSSVLQYNMFAMAGAVISVVVLLTRLVVKWLQRNKRQKRTRFGYNVLPDIIVFCLFLVLTALLLNLYKSLIQNITGARKATLAVGTTLMVLWFFSGFIEFFFWRRDKRYA